MKKPDPALEIELLPWAHTFRSDNHAKILAYIERLPKGSVLFAEIPEVSLDATANLFKRIQTELRFNAVDRAYGELYIAYSTYMGGDLLTFLGIYTVAKKRGIRLVPIDTSVRKDEKEFMYDIRNQNFIRNILKYNEAGKIFVLTGVLHTIQLKYLLKARGIKATYDSELYYSTIKELSAKPEVKDYDQTRDNERLRMILNQINITLQQQKERAEKLKQKILEKRAKKEQGKKRLETLQRNRLRK